ncbi:unnamed protein product [Lactuca virosa]|uniref:Uncharacterized protein n=1 Tax=Lactuca virosa TaxID=75947 RepID=A0AAU9NBY9_9ASTR|nr:unnamed protein product [Lactuca virosa]
MHINHQGCLIKSSVLPRLYCGCGGRTEKIKIQKGSNFFLSFLCAVPCGLLFSEDFIHGKTIAGCYPTR